MLNVFYGCARKHRPFNDQVLITTNDIAKKCYCSITGDIRKIINHQFDWLSSFDGWIFTPPCNYYSRANWRRETSKIAQETKDILPLCLQFCIDGSSTVPFLIENVQNAPIFKDWYPSYQFVLGGHTFWSNVLNASDFLGYELPKQNKQYVCRNKRDNNFVVDLVINVFLKKVADMHEGESLC